LLRDSGLTIARYAKDVVLLKPAPVVAARKQPTPQLDRPRLVTPPPAPDPRSQEDIIVTGRASGTALSPKRRAMPSPASTPICWRAGAPDRPPTCSRISPASGSKAPRRGEQQHPRAGHPDRWLFLGRDSGGRAAGPV
jgi:hypothetical protein